MMKANELMTGAFVYFNCFDGSKIVVRVTGFKDGIVYGDSKKGSHWCNIEKVEPIPLTPEIVEKNGFTETKNYYPYPTYKHEVNGKKFLVRVAFPKDSKATNRIKPFVEVDAMWCWHNSDCEFVHKLQRVLHLCEIEKNIEL